MNIQGWDWVFISFYGLNIVIYATLHGEEKKGKYNVLQAIISTAIGIFILWKGGLFV